jgi:hypothetical protein
MISTLESQNERHLPMVAGTRVLLRRGTHPVPTPFSLQPSSLVGCHLRTRLDQGSTADLALHSYCAPSFFFRHTVLDDY